MRYFARKLERHPDLARLTPLAVFCALTAAQGRFGVASNYWGYLLKTVVGAWMVWELRPCLTEARWKLSWEAVAVGVAVFALWVGLDGHYRRLGKTHESWNVEKQFGAGSAAAWSWILVRLTGSSLVVPPIEEVFYRSFLYRYIIQPHFWEVPFSRFQPLAFFSTAAVFGLSHPPFWLAGILCGLAYQGLALYKNRLGDAMTAHGVTNFLLGLWVVWRGAWHFW
jgi:hypothetical protein